MSSADVITLRLTPQAIEAWMESLARAPSDGGACVLLKRAEVADLIHDARAARQLHRLIYGRAGSVAFDLPKEGSL